MFIFYKKKRKKKKRTFRCVLLISFLLYERNPTNYCPFFPFYFLFAPLLLFTFSIPFSFCLNSNDLAVYGLRPL